MRYSYCPICGKEIGRREPDALVCSQCGYYFYQNSKPCVGAVVFEKTAEGPRVLFTRRGVEPYKGQWDFPGGFLRNGEHPLAGLKRELGEELAVEPIDPRFLCVQVDEYPRKDIAEEARFSLTLYYLCRLMPRSILRPGDDVTEARWFPFSSPPDPLAFACNARALREARPFIEAG